MNPEQLSPKTPTPEEALLNPVDAKRAEKIEAMKAAFKDWQEQLSFWREALESASSVQAVKMTVENWLTKSPGAQSLQKRVKAASEIGELKELIEGMISAEVRYASQLRNEEIDRRYSV